MRYLMQEFEKDPTWSKETYQRVARETNLSEAQVYKWGWDQKNKKAEEEAQNDCQEVDAEQEEDEEEDQEKDKDAVEKTIEESSYDDKDNKQRELDNAIQRAKIDQGEIDHGIIRPHTLDLKTSKCDSNKGSSTEPSQTSKLGKRPLADITRSAKQTENQPTKHQKKRMQKCSTASKDVQSDQTNPKSNSTSGSLNCSSNATKKNNSNSDSLVPESQPAIQA